MAALMATDSRAELSAKARKRRASSWTNAFPAFPVGGGGGSRLGLSGLFVTAGPVGCCSVVLVVGLGSWLAVDVGNVSRCDILQRWICVGISTGPFPPSLGPAWSWVSDRGMSVCCSEPCSAASVVSGFGGLLQCPWRKGRQFTHTLFAFLQEQLVQRPLALHRQHVLGIVYLLKRSDKRESSPPIYCIYTPFTRSSVQRLNRWIQV